ncbi:hypothetical protein HPB50_008070 [Hyalomma asiaticum]|uniref:Uncharacterized protein n=1 Tax=Hyalomma asiaticum TaxID=266040 RepID=A0ACB7RRR8_HYAAI|nr:hypothetical protein HPB50_008070 [Hyalomma asiaticum]
MFTRRPLASAGILSTLGSNPPTTEGTGTVTVHVIGCVENLYVFKGFHSAETFPTYQHNYVRGLVGCENRGVALIPQTCCNMDLLQLSAPREFPVPSSSSESSRSSNGAYMACRVCQQQRSNFFCDQCVRNGDFTRTRDQCLERTAFVDPNLTGGLPFHRVNSDTNDNLEEMFIYIVKSLCVKREVSPNRFAEKKLRLLRLQRHKASLEKSILELSAPMLEKEALVSRL